MSEVHPRVLHVEDNDFFARVTADVLADEYDMDVHTVRGAENALELLEDEWFDCIVSDYEMPGMDGLELLEAVRAFDSKIPFVLLTGGGSEQIASDAISAGVTDYLKKGEGLEQFAVLANRIENAITRRRTERLVDRQTTVNDLLWDVSQAVLEATSREDIERTVCDRLADSEAYALAWIGKVDEEYTVRPQATAGVEQRYLDPVVLDGHPKTSDRETDNRGTDDCGAVRRAAETWTVAVERSPTLEVGEDELDDVDSDRYAAAAVPLVYENRAYGVLSVWTDGCDAFCETERRVLSKFGSGVAYAIDSVQTRKELVRREQRLQVFNRILRHNLRNDLNVVLGRADNVAEEFPPARREAEVIKQKATELIEISEKAREVGKTLDREDVTQKQIDVTDCVERTCTEFRQSYPEAEILTDLPESARVYADKTLEAAISEVVENAIEHNDDDPTVRMTVSVSDDRDWVDVTVIDDGPGIPEEEREVLAEGEETALHHGSGLGLWLTNWIVGKFGGDVTFGDYHTGGGVVTLHLQHAVDDATSPRGVSSSERE